MHKEIGQKLLALAASPRDVQWVTWPQAGYSIPLELFVKFDAETDTPATGGLVRNTPVIGEDGPPPLEVPRRRRRKEASTDNNTSEEE